MTEPLYARLSAQPANERVLILSFASAAEAAAWDALARDDLHAALRVVMVMEAGTEDDPWNAYIWGPPAPPTWTAPSPESAADRIAKLLPPPPVRRVFDQDEVTQPIRLADA